MLVAYRGYSVILFAPLIAMLAVLFTDPAAVAPLFSGVFMERVVGFLKLYFPVFLLGARVRQADRAVGVFADHRGRRDSASSASGARFSRSSLVCALLTYGGVSLFVVVFAVYPFAAEIFRRGNIPKAARPRHDRARRVHVHDGCTARHAADSEHHSDDVLRHRCLGGAVARHHRQRIHSHRRHRVPRVAATRSRSGRAKAMAPVTSTNQSNCGRFAAHMRCIALLPLLVVGVANLLLTRAIPLLDEH